MIKIKNKKAFESMKETGKRLSSVFEQISKINFFGMTTLELDKKIYELLEKKQLISQAKGYKGFSGYSCLSLNDELVHGVPSNNKIIKEEDLIKVDICASFSGYCADMARMYTGNNENKIYKNILNCAENCMKIAFDQVFDGNFLGNLGHEIEKEILKNNFSVVKDFCGHGIGKKMHESPEVLNWGEKNTGIKIRYGMAFAIEPMFCEKKSDLFICDDGWTAKTVDGGVSAHIEDTFLVTENGPVITTRL